MKKLYLLFAATVYVLPLLAQKSTLITEGSEIKDAFEVKDIYTYPQFALGDVYFKNGTASTVKLNYNQLLGQMHFIDLKGDTLSLVNEKMIDFISIGKDTFYYNKDYLQQISAGDGLRLVMNQKIKLADKEKVGAYGVPVTNTSVFSLNSITIGSERVTRLGVQQILNFKTERKFYIGDSANNFSLLTKKNLIKTFPKNRDEIERYIDNNPTDFSNLIDVTKLFNFLKKLS